MIAPAIRVEISASSGRRARAAGAELRGRRGFRDGPPRTERERQVDADAGDRGRPEGRRRLRQVLGHPAGSPQLRTRLGYMTQAPSVYGDLTVRENLIFFARVARTTEDDRRARAGRGVSPRARSHSSRASRAVNERASRSPRRCSASPSSSCSTSRRSGLDPVLRRDSLGALPSARGSGRHAARVEPRHGRGGPLRRAAPAARRTASCTGDTERTPHAVRARTTWTPPFSGWWRPGHERAVSRSPSRSACFGQLRHDPRTLALALVVPCMLELILQQLFGRDSPIFQQVGTPLLGLFPFVTMFLVTSITMLRERTSGTLERLMTMPMHKVDLLAGYGIAFALLAIVQATLVSVLAFGFLGLEVDGPKWLVVGLAVANAVLGSTLGLFVSAFAQTEFQAVQFMPAVVFPQILLCGLFVAREEMATWLRVDLGLPSADVCIRRAREDGRRPARRAIRVRRRGRLRLHRARHLARSSDPSSSNRLRRRRVSSAHTWHPHTTAQRCLLGRSDLRRAACLCEEAIHPRRKRFSSRTQRFGCARATD